MAFLKRKTDITQDQMIDRNKMSFAAKEAYKFLRTNVQFSTAAEDGHAVIGVTSSVKGEGKSTTSQNLAYTLAEDGHRVVLVEADMRLPVLRKRLGILKKEGLSQLLAGQLQPSAIISKAADNENLYVIPGGVVPPNPSGLLGSERMDKLLSALRQKFDYVIIDLPPVQLVSDALVVGKKIDGLCIVVRQNFADRHLVEDTVRQIEKIDVKILGFIMTHASSKGSGYGKYGKYGRYGKYGKYKSYYGGYENTENTTGK